MKLVKKLNVLGIAILLAVGLGACDKNPGPAESAGKKIDQTADAAGKKLGEAAEKVGAKIGEQEAKVGVAIDDAEVTARVKAAIFAEPGLKTLQINVDTVQGVVTLSGSVDSAPSIDRAKTLAAAMAGVKGVESRLVTKVN